MTERELGKLKRPDLLALLVAQGQEAAALQETIPVKAAMNLMGMEVGEPRMPLTPMETAHVDVLRGELQKVGLL